MQEWKFIHILYQVYLCTVYTVHVHAIQQCHLTVSFSCFFIGFCFFANVCRSVDVPDISFFLSRETKTQENEEKEIQITYYIGSSSLRLTIAEYTSNELLRTRPITLNVKHSRHFNGFAWQPIKCGIICFSFSFCLRMMCMCLLLCISLKHLLSTFIHLPQWNNN